MTRSLELGEHELRSEIRELTTAMRTSEEPYWSELRTLLRQQGVEPASAILLDKTPDEASDFVAVLTAEGRTYEGDYHDAETSGHDATLDLWDEFFAGSSAWSLYERRINCGKALWEK